MALPPRLPLRLTARLLMGVTALAISVAAAWAWVHWQRTHDVVAALAYPLQAENSGDWKPYGGSWQIADGAVQSNSYERGAKLLAGSRYWSNYTMSSDIWFEGPAADMGVVIRTNEEAEGVDAYR